MLVVNESNWEKVTLNIFPMDIIQNEEGIYKTVEIGKGAPSCANWLKFKDTIITIKPTEAEKVIVTIDVPLGLKGGRYGAIAFETRPPKEERKYRTKIPVFFKIMIKPLPKPLATITDIKFEQPEKVKRLTFMGKFKDALAVLVSVKNESDIHVSINGSLILRNKLGRMIKKFPLGEGRGSILPRTTIDVVSVIKKLPPGEYIAEAIIRYGTRNTAMSRISLFITGEKISKSSLIGTTPVPLAIIPDVVKINILPNSFRTGLVILHNQDTTGIRISTQIKDLFYDENGDLFFSDTGGSRWSATKWVAMDTTEFHLKGNERKVIKLNVQVPGEIGEGFRYTCLVFEACKEGMRDTALPIPFSVPIYLNYGGIPKMDVRIEKIEIASLIPANIILYLRNLGNAHLKPAGNIAIYLKQKASPMMSERLKKLGEFPLKEFQGEVLPDGIAKIETNVPLRLTKGKYLIRTEIKYGGSGRTVLEEELEI